MLRGADKLTLRLCGIWHEGPVVDEADGREKVQHKLLNRVRQLCQVDDSKQNQESIGLEEFLKCTTVTHLRRLIVVLHSPEG